MVDSKSYCNNAKTDLSLGLTTCDTEHLSPTHPHLTGVPRDEIAACDQVPHSDQVR